MYKQGLKDKFVVQGIPSSNIYYIFKQNVKYEISKKQISIDWDIPYFTLLRNWQWISEKAIIEMEIREFERGKNNEYL